MLIEEAMASLLRCGRLAQNKVSSATRFLPTFIGSNCGKSFLLSTQNTARAIQFHRALALAQEFPTKDILKDASQISPPETSKIDEALDLANWSVKKFGRVTSKHIRSIVQSMKSENITAQQSLLLIRCHGSLLVEEPPSERTRLALKHWQMLEELKAPLDLNCYNALLKIYVENNHSFNPMEFVQSMEAKDILPNRITYQRLIHAYCSTGDLEGAFKVLEIMKTKDFPITENVFNSLITGHSKAGDIESAKGVLQVMFSSGIEPDRETYRTLLSAYASHGMLDEITATQAECEKKEIYLYDRDVMEMLFEAASNGHIEVASALLNQMRKDVNYNQDCRNLITRLMLHKQEDMAFKALSTLNPRAEHHRLFSTVRFFIPLAVSSDLPPEKVTSFFAGNEELSKRGAILEALELATMNSRADLSTLLWDLMITKKDFILPINFSRLLAAEADVNGLKGVVKVIRKMTQMKIYPDFRMVCNRILPQFENHTPNNTMSRLREANLPYGIIFDAMLLQSLAKNDLKAAASFAQTYNKSLFDKEELINSTAKAFLATGDALSTVELVHSLVMGEKDASLRPIKSATLLDSLLNQVINITPDEKADIIVNLLSELSKYGLTISKNMAQSLEKKLENCSGFNSELLDQLSSGKLTAISRKKTVNSIHTEFSDHVKEERVEEAMKYYEVNHSKETKLNTSLRIKLMGVCIKHDKVDNAMKIFTDVISESPNVVINQILLLRLASLLLASNRSEEALIVLKQLKPSKDDSNKNSVMTMERRAVQLLDIAVDKSDIELTMQLFNVLKDSECFKITQNVLLRIVKCHANCGDLDGALNCLTEYATQYRCTPYKQQLTVLLIDHEDSDALQRLLDLSIRIHGEANSIVDLALGFLECGRLREAKKVLESQSNGILLRPEKLQKVLGQFSEPKQIALLENLMEATKNMIFDNQSIVHDHLLNAYIRTQDVDKALELWMKLEEANVVPPRSFIVNFANFLKSMNRMVPFNDPVPDSSSVSSSSQLETLIHDGKLDEAKDLVVSILGDRTKKIKENKQDMIMFFNQLSANGDVTTIDSLGPHMSNTWKQQVLYDNCLVKAMCLNPSAASDCLDSILSDYKANSATAGESAEAKKLNVTGQLLTKLRYHQDFVLLFEQNPHLLSKWDEISHECLKHGFPIPANSLFSYYLQTNKKQEAINTYVAAQSLSQSLAISPLCKQIRKKADTKLASEVVDILKSYPDTNSSKMLGFAYSAWIDVLCEGKLIDEVSTLVKESIDNGLQLGDGTVLALRRLKEDLETSGKPVPFTIPEISETVSEVQTDSQQ